jgi:hypothetical protein
MNPLTTSPQPFLFGQRYVQDAEERRRHWCGT